jgi:hypothetical protein
MYIRCSRVFNHDVGHVIFETRAQVLKRDPVTLRVTLAMATIPKMDGSVFEGPKGTTLVFSCWYCACFYLHRCWFIFDCLYAAISS